MRPVKSIFQQGVDVSDVVRRILSRSIPEPNSGCRLWEGGHNSGYGIIGVGGSIFYAHRIICETTHGQMSPDDLACHRCDVSFCVESEHLFPGTYRVNVHDCIAKKRWTHGERHGGAKLSEVAVADIRLRRTLGRSATDLSADYQIHPSTVRRIVNGDLWRHV